MYMFMVKLKGHVDDHILHTATQAFDCGPVTARNIDRKSLLLSFASHLLLKSRVEQFHTIDFIIPGANLHAHGLIIARVRAIWN